MTVIYIKSADYYLHFGCRWNMNGHHRLVVVLGYRFQVIVCYVSVVFAFTQSTKFTL